MKPMKRVYVLVAVDLEKDVAQLPDKVSGRAYTIPGVWDTDAWLIDGLSSTQTNLVKAVIEEHEERKKAQEGHQKASTSLDLIAQRRVVASHG